MKNTNKHKNENKIKVTIIICKIQHKTQNEINLNMQNKIIIIRTQIAHKTWTRNYNKIIEINTIWI